MVWWYMVVLEEKCHSVCTVNGGVRVRSDVLGVLVW